MRDFQILVDSTADITESEMKDYDIDYLHMSFYLNGKIYDASLNWTEIDPLDYYKLMREGFRPMTGQASYNEITNKFASYLEKGKDILYIGCSSSLSGTINLARIIACDFIDKYPDQKIVIVDSLRSNYSQAMLAIHASRMKKGGTSLGECVRILFQDRLKFQTYGLLESLEWIKKAGRVRKTYKVKNILGYRFLVYSDAEGENALFDSYKSRKSAINALAQIVKERLENNINNLYIEHGDCYEDALLLKDILIEKGIKNEIRISYLGPIVGATIGPDSLTVSFYGKKVLPNE